MIAVLKLPKMVTKLKRAPSPLALCDAERPSSSDAPQSEVKASCLVKVDALQSSFDELKTLCVEVEAQA